MNERGLHVKRHLHVHVHVDEVKCKHAYTLILYCDKGKTGNALTDILKYCESKGGDCGSVHTIILL